MPHHASYRRRPARSGFTLIELMVAVAIVGLLASIAVPTLAHYVQKAKTSEARGSLGQIYEGARAYFANERGAEGSITTSEKQFPVTQATTPAATCCAGGGPKCLSSESDWDAPTWHALSFEITDPHYYRYAWQSGGSGTDSTFTARAHGDLDCDGDESTFEMYGEILDSGDVTRSDVARKSELE